MGLRMSEDQIDENQGNGGQFLKLKQRRLNPMERSVSSCQRPVLLQMIMTCNLLNKLTVL